MFGNKKKEPKCVHKWKYLNAAACDSDIVKIFECEKCHKAATEYLEEADEY